ncbi:MAG TPA: DNA polymerase I [Fimbriimonas sp.]|nr:DNA polymerase I [Fimbriimonas sp.]
MASKRLVIIDGYSLLYRAFFATRYLSTSDGRPTNALYGFVGMMFLLLEKVKPDAIVVALDAPGKTFRHAELETYKGTRKETQDELRVQLVEARKLIETLGVPSVEVVGFEADDIVGTISRLAEENGYDTTIVTGDLDSLQLVDHCVSVLTTSKGVSDTVTYNVAAVKERYGFGPEFIPDFKALKGDTSDNMPGVPGIGDKGAAELIQQFGTIEQMIERFAEIPPKYQKKMEGLADAMRLSKKLATIVRDVPLQYDFKPFQLNENQMEAAIAIMDDLEFRVHVRRAPQVLGRYLGGRAPSHDSIEEIVEVVDEAIEATSTTVESFEELRRLVAEQPYAVYFSGAAPRVDLFEEEVRRAHVALGRRVLECPEQNAIQLISDSPQQATLHDSKPLYRRAKLNIAPPVFDTFLAAYILRSERTQYPLRDLVNGYLEVQPPTTPEQMAAALYLLRDPLETRLKKESQLDVLTGIELPLVPILAEMENFGIKTDRTQLREFSKELEIAIDRTAKHIFELACCEFTIGSPKQLGEVLFDKLQLPGATKTKTGYATGVEVLSVIAAEHEIAAEVLSWRELTKLKSTYADSLEKLIQSDGRIHTTYNQIGAATGRLSSNDPNLQNIPIRTELGRGIRKAFVAAEGYELASLDYSQIELRVLASMCGEPALVEAFQTRVDVHTVTAQQMFGLGEGQATKEQRRLAKMLNYAVLYGVSEFGLAQQLGAGFSLAEAKELIRLYNERFPTIRDFTSSVVQEARSKGFTTTLKGRRRYFPDIHAPKINDRKAVERQAMNAPIQGTAADMIKLAMIDVHRQLKGSSTRMLLTVHDELVFEMKKGEEGLVPQLRADMENALPLNVPVEVDAKVGPDWNDMIVV